MTKTNEVAELIDLGDVTIETRAGGNVQIPDGPLSQKSFQEGLSND